MTTRRTFIQQAGLLSTGLLINPSVFLPKEKIVGLQLYSLRDVLPKDVKGTLAKVAKAGYKDLELYGYDHLKKSFFGYDAKAFKDIIASNGLKTTSGHYNPTDFMSGKGTADLEAQIEAAKVMGHEHLIIPYLSDDLRTKLDDYKVFADRLNKAGELCKKSGLQLAYHNHDFELKNWGDTTGLDIALQETDKNLVDFELDLYWVVRAAKDPVKYFQKYPGRFKAWHVKDMDKTNRDLNTEIGSGSIDYKRIFSYAKVAGVQHYFMEQENFVGNIDPFTSITKSCKYIKTSLLK